MRMKRTWRATVWDPLTRTFATQSTPFDMFCNGMVNLPDGRMFINGGNLEYNPFKGEKRSAVYDPNTEVFTNVEDMADGRWYPTPTVLGDGRIWTFSGLDVNGSTNSTVEIYTVGSGWSQEYGAAWTPPLYPRMHLLPNGNLFYSGWGRNSRIFNTTTNTWSGTIATTIFTSARVYGTSVLLPLSPTDNYRARVMIFGGANPATNTTEVIEPLAASPAWSNSSSVTTPMSQARIQLNEYDSPERSDSGNGRVELGRERKHSQPERRSLQSGRYSDLAQFGRRQCDTAGVPLQCAAAAGRDRDAHRR